MNAPFDYRSPEEKRIDFLREEHRALGEHPFTVIEPDCPECQREQED